MTDVIIIGKGPAGITTALYTIRSGLSTVIVGKGFGSVYKADRIENYYGFANGISGKELMDEGVLQAKNLGCTIIEDEIVGISADEGFSLIGKAGTYTARAVVLAVGQPERKLRLPGLKQFEGKGVSYCTTCDGFFYRNKKVAVIGYNDFALHEAQALMDFTSDITLLTNGMKLAADKKYQSLIDAMTVIDTPVQALFGDEFIQKVQLKDGSAVDVDGVFIAYGSASAVDFALKLGVVTENNAVKVDQDMWTGIQGLYACGDCTGGFRQISTAVGEGAIASKSVTAYIKRLQREASQ